MARNKTRKPIRGGRHPLPDGAVRPRKRRATSNSRAEPVVTAATAERMKPPSKGVKVRMYRTGLGDCFLLALPRSTPATASRDVFYMLVDCGVYKGTPKSNNAPRIAKIVENIRDATAGHLDLLVITHEHWDHVSAFHPSQSQQIFKDDIELGTLWMAWTEDLSNKLAKDLHDGRKAARTALTEAIGRMRGLSAYSHTHDLINKVLDFFGDPVEAKSGSAAASNGSSDNHGAAVFAAKSFQTEEAMTWIREKYGKGKTKFLHPGDGPLTFDGVSDARVYVLGPPEDPVLIKRSNPSASGSEVYTRALAAAIEASFFAALGMIPTSLKDPPDKEAIEDATEMSVPFDAAHRVKVNKARKDPFFRARYFNKKTTPEWRAIEGDWLENAGEFALQLDSATNNTSLAFALEVGPPGEGKVLLFPGDAQVGNWQSWFGKVKIGKKEVGKDMLWKAGGKSITAEDLLRRTALYKVGHHGSHNATLRAQGLELMSRPDGAGELVAMLPVDEHVARDLAHYGEMPLLSLVKELAIRTRGRIARNDEGAKPENRESTLNPIPDVPQISSDFVDAKTDLYFEYTVSP